MITTFKRGPCRILKRHLSDVIHRRMIRDLASLPAQPLLAAQPRAAAASQGWPDRAERQRAA